MHEITSLHEITKPGIFDYLRQLARNREELSYTFLWKLTEVIPQKKIVYDWRYEGFPGQGLVTWELEGTADGTKLRLTNTIVAAFPDSDPAFRRESCEAGWQYFINDRLKSYLENSV